MKVRLLVLLLLISIVSAQESAFIYIDGGTGTSKVGTSWVNVGAGSASDFVESSTSANWSYSNNVLTASSSANVEGYYSIKYSLSFNADDAEWFIGISINGATPSEPIFTRSISNSRKDAGNISGIIMTTIAAGETVEMLVKSNSSNNDFTPSYAQLAIVPAAQNTNNLYAGMNINSTTTYPTLSSSSFTKLTGFSVIPEINGWTFGTNDLTANAGSAGLYYMSYSVSFTGDKPESSPDLFMFKLDVNGTSTHILASRKTSRDDIGNVSGGGLVSISEGDVVSISAQSLKGGDLIIYNANLGMFKLGDVSSPQAFGVAGIVNDQTISIAATDTWTTVGDYVSLPPNLWTFASNMFTPNSVSADGYYYLEYSTSLSTNNSGGDEVELGVFVGSSEKPSFTVNRKLSSNSDMGAVCGVGLFSVDDFTSTITLKIKNTTSSNDLVIHKSLVGFSQIRYQNDPATPISLNSFNVEEQHGAINLNWQTASEVENLGYKIYRKVDDGMFKELSSYVYNDALQGQGTTTDIHDYKFIDSNVKSGKKYTYMLSDVSYHMEEIKHTDFLKTVYLAKGIEVSTAYPNPFNPQSTILYTLDKNENIKIELLDISGKLIRTLVHRDHVPGNYEVNINEPTLGSGIYLVRVQAGTQLEVQKIMMLK